MFSSSYDPFEDFGFGPGGFLSPYESRRRQELARRQQMELERRRKLELERRRQLLMERERRAKEEEERRRELEAMRKQQQMKEENMRGKQFDQSQNRRARRYAPGSIVLGPDGNIYRVISPANDDTRLFGREERPLEQKKHDIVSGANQSKEKEDCDEKMHPANQNESFEEESKNSSIEPEEYIDDDCANHTHEDHIYDAQDTPHQSIHTQEVEVEDVPDEEDEELRELHSVWRNRSPCPGQWMEPIEYCDR
jgi:hypothetical protein